MWQKLTNSFLTTTESSHELCRSVVINVRDSLAENESIGALEPISAFFNPLAQTYLDTFSDWDVVRRNYQTGRTAAFEEAYATYAPKMRRWKEDLTYLLRGDQVNLNYLFPDGKISLYTEGSQEQRLQALTNFNNTLSQIPNPALTVIKAEVAALKTALDVKFTDKNRFKEATEIKSAALEQARITICIALYRVQARLMDYFAEDPAQIERILPVDLLTRKAQMLFVDNNLPPATARLVMTRTLDDGQKIKISNNGLVSLRFLRSEQMIDDGASMGVTVDAAQQITIDAAALGRGRYYHVRNGSDRMAAFELEIMG